MFIWEDKKYRLNIENIVAYCAGSEEHKITQCDITELYRQDNKGLDLIQKQINTSNIKNGQLKVVDSYRYDIVKGLLQVLFQIGFEQGNGIITKNTNAENISIGEGIVFNTLLWYKFAEEIIEQ